MSFDVSVILSLRDAERMAGPMVGAPAEAMESRPDTTFELIAVDQRSHDNTLSALSVLKGRHPELRIVQDVVPGDGIRQGLLVARGDLLLIVDRVVEPELCRWAVDRVKGGERAALVPGEVLAMQTTDARELLRRLRGGLVSAQRQVRTQLKRQPIAVRHAPSRGRVDRAHRVLRGALGRLGLGALDKPRK